MKRWELAIAVVLLCLFGAQTAWPQSRHSLAAGAGWQARSVRETFVSPLRYQGDDWVAVLQYRGAFWGGRPHLEFDFARLPLASDAGARNTASTVRIAYRFGYLRPLSGGAARSLRLAAGGALAGYYERRSQQFVRGDDERYEHFIASAQLAGELAAKLRPGTQLRLAVATPLLTYLRQPPQSIKGSYEAHLATFVAFSGLDATTAFDFDLGGSVGLTARYRVDYQIHDVTHDSRRVTQQFHLLLRLVF